MLSLMHTFGKYLGSFLFRNTLDLLEKLFRCVCHRLNRVVSAIYKQLYVSLRET